MCLLISLEVGVLLFIFFKDPEKIIVIEYFSKHGFLRVSMRKIYLNRPRRLSFHRSSLQLWEELETLYKIYVIGLNSQATLAQIISDYSGCQVRQRCLITLLRLSEGTC